MERDQGFFLGGQGRLVHQVGAVVKEARDLQEKYALALVATHVWLIAVVAKALAAPFDHLRRREATKRAARRRWHGCQRRGLGRGECGRRRLELGLSCRLAWWSRRIGRQCRSCALFICTCQRHGALEILGELKLDVDVDGVGEVARELADLLFRG
jgi:hypothetical protein